MNLEERVARLEMILMSRASHTGWVKAEVASQVLQIPKRRLVEMYDQGVISKDAARQTNHSTKRRQLVFNIERVKESLGHAVTS